jgi:hypothetical protein
MTVCCLIYSRHEIAVVPHLGSDYVYEDGLLIIDEYLAVSIVKDPKCSPEIVMCLVPQVPGWQRLVDVTCPNTVRLLLIALRFHANSSTLWRFREVLANDDDLTKVVEMSGFKYFNYHLYNYLNYKICKTISTPLQLLIADSRRYPNNFSPLHIILRVFQNGEYITDSVFMQILAREKSGALIEFASSFLLVVYDRGLKESFRAVEIAKRLVVGSPYAELF